MRKLVGFKWLALFGVIVTFLIGFALSKNYDSLGIGRDYVTIKFDIANQSEYWNNKIKTLGPANAYKEFKEEYQNSDMTTQHVASHFFGDLLYKHDGLDGLAACDGVFAYGCYHVFTAKALLKDGTGGIGKLNNICLEKFGMTANECQHGIGHGLAEYFGYKTEGLTKALDLCNLTTQLGPLSGCSWGVFMQHNVIITADSSASNASIKLKKLSAENTYEPCASSPKKFRNICYTQIVLWWDKALNGDYKKIGEFCSGIPETNNGEACAFGVGMIGASLSNYDVQKTLEKCEAMTNEKFKLVCKSGAYVSFNSFPKAKPFAKEICRGAGEQNTELCSGKMQSLIYE